jgi:hypothetical protein
MVQTDSGTQFKSWQDKMDENSVLTTFNDQRGAGVGHYVPKPSDALKK